MCSLRDGCYKQLENASCVQQKPKRRMTGQLAVLGAAVVLPSVFN